MKREILRFLTFFTSLLLLGACSDRFQSQQGEFWVKIPWLAEGGYQLTEVSIGTMSNVREAGGEAAEFVYSPSLVNKKLVGEKPVTQFSMSANGTIIPLNRLSTELFSIYAHLERLKEMDLQYGVHVNQTPRQVGVAVNYVDDGGRLYNNAMYVGDIDAILVVPYNVMGLPIAVNGGVLAHEHFHSIFYKLVIAPLTTNSPLKVYYSLHEVQDMGAAFLQLEQGLHQHERFVSKADSKQSSQKSLDYHVTLIRGINEGFADYWGWLYSGDDNFVGRSLPSESKVRRLDGEASGILGKAELLDIVSIYSNSSDVLNYYSYKMGTEYARLLTRAAFDLEKSRGLSLAQAKKEIASTLISSLYKLNSDINTLNQGDHLDPHQVLTHFTQNLKQKNLLNCKYWQRYTKVAECE